MIRYNVIPNPTRRLIITCWNEVIMDDISGCKRRRDTEIYFCQPPHQSGIPNIRN